MKNLDLILAAVLLAMTLVIIVLSFVPAYVASAARALSRSAGLALPDELAPRIRARVARRIRAVAAGASASIVISVALLATGLLQPSQRIGDVWLVLGAYFAGMAVGAAINATTDRPTTDENGPRLARSGAVSLADYVSPLERIGARVMVGLAALVLVVSLLATGLGPARVTSGFAILALALASLVLFEIAGRRIVDRPQPVGSPTELAWDDALRAGSIRELVTAPLVVGAWGTMFVGADQLFSSQIINGLWAVAGLALAGGYCAVAIYSVVSRPQQYYLRRLWPEVAAAGLALAAAPGTAQVDSLDSNAR